MGFFKKVGKAITGTVGGLISPITDGLNAVKGLFTNKNKEAKRADDRQYEQQKRLNKLSSIQAKGLADYDHELKMKMWKDTNYTAQLAEGAKAGVSKAGVLGMGGMPIGQATTVGSGGGGSQASGGAENEMARLNSRLMEAQVANINAQTEKTRSETEEKDFDNTVRAEVGSPNYIRKQKAELAKLAQQDISAYRQARELEEVLSNGEGLNIIIDTFGAYSGDGNHQKLARNQARALIAKWDKLEAEINNARRDLNVKDQGISESKAREALAKAETEITNFSVDLQGLGLNPTTVKILEVILKTMLGMRTKKGR